MTDGVTILGVPIDNVTMEETLARIDEFVREGSYHQIATANVDFLVHAIDNREYRENLCRCDLVVADGMPVVVASRLLGSPLRERVAGADLVPLLAKKGYRIFLLGAAPEVCSIAARRMEELGGKVVGQLSPPIAPLAKFDNDSIIAEIEKADPEILMVALGSPKQELWLQQNRHRLKVPVCIGIGGSLDFLAGTVSRAPEWMQKTGLEWVYRIWAEPRRLAKRYLKGGVWMARYFTIQLAVSLSMRKVGPALEVGSESIGSVSILSATGMMTGPRLAQLESAASQATARGGPLVIDLTGVSYLGADGLRTLTGLLRNAANKGGQLWLAGAGPALTRTLKAARCENLFRATPSVFDAVRQASRGRLQLNLELGEGWAVCRIGGEIPEGARSTLEGICRQVIETNEFFEFNNDGALEFDAKGLVEPAKSGCRLVTGDRTGRPVAEIAAW
jgi:N-acetylglucosaminyldiphosphoundecaprenol N-acetyl-beta-D-mannosaminyltransferase